MATRSPAIAETSSTVGQTGERWYFQGSRKTKAMEAWSEALLAACKDAGGIYPD
ncbi:MAG TPA: hypothetical protein VMT72_16770 [Pseudolabrys sp.]|nr:hypothetical protein [Pseudolabrys sp.]